MQLLRSSPGPLLLPRPQLLQVLLQDLLGAPARHRLVQPPQAADAQLQAVARQRQRHRRRQQQHQRRWCSQQELLVPARLHLRRPRLSRRNFEKALTRSEMMNSSVFLIFKLFFVSLLLSLVSTFNLELFFSWGRSPQVLKGIFSMSLGYLILIRFCFAPNKVGTIFGIVEKTKQPL